MDLSRISNADLADLVSAATEEDSDEYINSLLWAVLSRMTDEQIHEAFIRTLEVGLQA